MSRERREVDQCPSHTDVRVKSQDVYKTLHTDTSSTNKSVECQRITARGSNLASPSTSANWGEGEIEAGKSPRVFQSLPDVVSWIEKELCVWW